MEPRDSERGDGSAEPRDSERGTVPRNRLSQLDRLPDLHLACSTGPMLPAAGTFTSTSTWSLVVRAVRTLDQQATYRSAT
jgi:hypothetical protein